MTQNYVYKLQLIHVIIYFLVQKIIKTCKSGFNLDRILGPFKGPKGTQKFLEKLGPRNKEIGVFFVFFWPEICTFWPEIGKLKLIIGIPNA